MREKGFTLVELLAVIGIVATLSAITLGSLPKLMAASSLAVSSNNIRQLAAGGIAYLADNNQRYWPWREGRADGDVWWWGFETIESKSRPEGSREFDPDGGPLGGYVPKGFRPDPSFALGGQAFKPKFRNGYIGAGYNTLLGGGWNWVNDTLTPRVHHGQLSDPSAVIVFFTAAQVNTFQSPASSGRPMLEEFYGIDAKERTIHFRHNGKAMVSFASGNAGFLEMDESTRDKRMPNANVGRLAPAGSTLYLK